MTGWKFWNQTLSEIEVKNLFDSIAELVSENQRAAAALLLFIVIDLCELTDNVVWFWWRKWLLYQENRK